ncbi:MAG: PBP1A family penicillin-binding protein [Granulicatella sp.]|nr:PBP1A family penicillin-binding protein [Granulicatella sp.]
MNENQPLEPQRIPSRHDKMEKEISSTEKWYKKIWNHPWFKNFREFWNKYHLTKLFLTLFLTFIAFFLAYLVYGAKTADVSGLRAGMIQETVIYDEDGQEAGALNISKAEYVPLNEISTYMKDAVLSTEDKRFYNHKGFDLVGILRAFAGVIIHRGNIVGGGSTLTQQLAKNTFLTLDQTLLRKAKELFLSLEIEKHYTKDQIFEMYLNNAYFGNGAYGIENAARRYFGKSAANLSLGESAILAGALKAPSYYNPIDNYDATVNRRATVLKLMVNNGKISEQDANIASESEISLVDNYVANSRYRYPYYFDAVINEITQNYGIKEEDLFNKGYRIYTGLNQKLQADMEETFGNTQLYPSYNDGTKAQAASIAMEPQTGNVLAVVGGRIDGTGKHTFRGFNRATQMKVQPGSTFKPLAVYTLALEEGYEPNSTLIDEKRSYGPEKYTPENWNHQNKGTVTMTEALSLSWNAPAVWLLDQLGLKKGIEKVHQFGISTVSEDEYLGIALGGLTKGVSPMEMASAYTTFANKGVRAKGRFVTKIVDATGAVIVDNTIPQTNKVTSETVANKMTSMLLTVYAPGGGGANAAPAGYTIAGKTGTTETVNGEDGARDQWMIGYTPDMVVATWMGYDDSAKYSLAVSSNQGVGPLFQLEMYGLLSTSSKKTPFGVEPANTNQKNNSPVNMDKWIQKAEEKGKQLWSKVQEWTDQLWKKVGQ